MARISNTKPGDFLFGLSRLLLSRMISPLSHSWFLARYGDLVHRMLFSGWKDVTFNRQNLSFNVPNQICDFRVSRIFSKEPGTIDWLESLNPGTDTMWDVGANLGLYTTLAASKGVRVVAFEPSLLNIMVLALNVQRNQVQGLVQIVPVATSNESHLYYHAGMPGRDDSHGHSYGHAILPWTSDTLAVEANTNIQSLPGAMLTLDQCAELFNLPLPTHLKMDIDGGELKALSGARGILKSVNSLLLELSDECSIEVRELLAEEGFEMQDDEKYHPNNLWLRCPS